MWNFYPIELLERRSAGVVGFLEPILPTDFSFVDFHQIFAVCNVTDFRDELLLEEPDRVFDQQTRDALWNQILK